MELTREIAEKALEEANKANPGPWYEHSKYVALACQNIASRCQDMDEDLAYVYGILHDIGRYAGVTSEKHLIDGYRYCVERGWKKAAQICISHALARYVKEAVYDDYDYLVQLCDALALPTGFCLLEKRFVDVTIRYGTHPATIERWKAILGIKEHFEKKMGCSIYDCLPGVIENSFR